MLLELKAQGLEYQDCFCIVWILLVVFVIDAKIDICTSVIHPLQMGFLFSFLLSVPCRHHFPRHTIKEFMEGLKISAKIIRNTQTWCSFVPKCTAMHLFELFHWLGRRTLPVLPGMQEPCWGILYSMSHQEWAEKHHLCYTFISTNLMIHRIVQALWSPKTIRPDAAKQKRGKVFQVTI